MALTDIQVRSAKPKDKDYKLADGSGLYLQVATTGGKRWRFKYRYGGKEKLLALGIYPDISLQEARNKLREARNLLANGHDPSMEKKALKRIKAEQIAEAENSFEIVAREWHKKFSGQWSQNHASTTMDRLERDVFPWLGKKPIGEIKPPDLLAVLRRVESRGALETAHRIRTICGQVLRYAVATGRAERDSATDLRGALPPVREKHHAAITDPEEVGDLLRAIDGFKGTYQVKCALKLAPMFFVRPGELRQMEWAEIDLDSAQWNIPAEKMKMKQPHIVPLAGQALSILEELKPLT
ncbi:MAG TPA: integrase arm-type DNA-binding domain-containing protein, partial [Deltaproteobacteria bacterium]|nr:integrase arm-type DNA-binding domain-containing protein [Deltaproteobacteria bacterium]